MSYDMKYFYSHGLKNWKIFVKLYRVNLILLERTIEQDIERLISFPLMRKNAKINEF